MPEVLSTGARDANPVKALLSMKGLIRVVTLEIFIPFSLLRGTTSLGPLGSSGFELLEACIDQDDTKPLKGEHPGPFAVADRGTAEGVIDILAAYSYAAEWDHIWAAASYAHNVVGQMVEAEG